MRGSRSRSIFPKAGRYRTGCLAALLAAAAGGAAIAQPTATLTTIGKDVQVNGARAGSGTAISFRDEIRVGPKSSARVDWPDGTHLYVAGGTVIEPDCMGWLANSHVGCGWYLVDTNHATVQVLTGTVAAPSAARFAVEVSPGPTFDVFVLGGKLAMRAGIERRIMAAGDRVTVEPRPNAYGKPHGRFGTFSGAEGASIAGIFAPWKLPPPS